MIVNQKKKKRNKNPPKKETHTMAYTNMSKWKELDANVCREGKETSGAFVTNCKSDKFLSFVFIFVNSYSIMTSLLASRLVGRNSQACDKYSKQIAVAKHAKKGEE